LSGFTLVELTVVLAVIAVVATFATPSVVVWHKRLKASFEGASARAVTPFASWPYGIRPPQCLIEAWPARTTGQAGAFLITARGFGRIAGNESWLQQEIEVSEHGAVRHWRRIVARPFQQGSP